MIKYLRNQIKHRIFVKLLMLTTINKIKWKIY